MKRLCLVFVFGLFYSQHIHAEVKFGLHFDDLGNIVQPDQEFLARGVEDEAAGFRSAAMKNFIRSASYGNQNAMSLVGFYHFQDKAYTTALAWLHLVDLSLLANKAPIEELVVKLENYLTQEEMVEVKSIHNELKETYGTYPTLLKREAWRKGLKFTGTRIPGHIPNFLTFSIGNGFTVSGSQVKKQVERFVYEYDFNFIPGEVILNDIEVVEDDSNDQK